YTITLTIASLFLNISLHDALPIIINWEVNNMKHVFHNLKNLKDDMVKNGWIIDSFTFKYKNINYVALVHLPQKNEKVPKYALVRDRKSTRLNSSHVSTCYDFICLI